MQDSNSQYHPASPLYPRPHGHFCSNAHGSAEVQAVSWKLRQGIIAIGESDRAPLE